MSGGRFDCARFHGEQLAGAGVAYQVGLLAGWCFGMFSSDWRGGVWLARDCLIGGRAGARESVSVAWFPGWCFWGAFSWARLGGGVFCDWVFIGAGVFWCGVIGHAVCWCGSGARVFLAVGSSVAWGVFVLVWLVVRGGVKRRVFWLCQVVGRFPGRAGVWSSVPTYGCGRAIPARGVCFDWRGHFHGVIIGA